jgi:redox-regulated HSP33 family molecular chaperone
MAEMTRETLEQEALKAVCSCWVYDLQNELETVPDEELRNIIKDPQFLHKQNQIHNPVSEEEYQEELKECTSAPKKA